MTIGVARRGKKRDALWQTSLDRQKPVDRFGILWILLAASLAFYAFTAWMWPRWESAHYAYNGSLYDQIWEILTLALLAIYLLFNLLADVMQSLLDPRLRR